MTGLPRHGFENVHLLSRDQGATWEAIHLPYGDSYDYELTLLPDGGWIVTTIDPAAATWTESADLGATWRTRENLPSRLLALALDPGEPEHAWAITHRGVFRTTRGGASWAPVFAPDVPLGTALLAVDPEDPRVLLLGTRGSPPAPTCAQRGSRPHLDSKPCTRAGAIYPTGLVAGRRGGTPFALASFETETFEDILAQRRSRRDLATPSGRIDRRRGRRRQRLYATGSPASGSSNRLDGGLGFAHDRGFCGQRPFCPASWRPVQAISVFPCSPGRSTFRLPPAFFEDPAGPASGRSGSCPPSTASRSASTWRPGSRPGTLRHAELRAAGRIRSGPAPSPAKAGSSRRAACPRAASPRSAASRATARSGSCRGISACFGEGWTSATKA